MVYDRPICVWEFSKVMKTFIQNRNNKKLCVVAEESEYPGKLAFIAHGLGGNKDEAHIRSMIEALLESGYAVVSFDAAHTFGESEGEYEDATQTNYYEDLQDVILWASKQDWYVEPFVIGGHSFGGGTSIMYAQDHPEKIKALFPIATVISGELSLKTSLSNPRRLSVFSQWKQDGVLIQRRRNGDEKRLKWACMEDRLKYNLLTGAGKLTMPVLMVVGDMDESTPPQHQKLLFDILPGEKEFHIIQGAIHTFDEPHEREELKQIIKKWMKKI